MAKAKVSDVENYVSRLGFEPATDPTGGELSRFGFYVCSDCGFRIVASDKVKIMDRRTRVNRVMRQHCGRHNFNDRMRVLMSEIEGEER